MTAEQPTSLDELADQTWGGQEMPALAGAWRHLRTMSRADAGSRDHERKRIESNFRTETNVLEDYAGRYPIELLQNAQDAAAEAKRKGAVVWIDVSDTALLIGNEGRPFDERRLDGLLHLSFGSKSAANVEHETIGYKGIGFTSVFEITDRPQVISEFYSFSLDGARAQALVEEALGHRVSGVPRRQYAFPITPIELGEDASVVERMRAEGAVTVIRLPFSDGDGVDAPEEIRAFVEQSLSPEVLLFMPALRRIKLTGNGADVEWSMARGGSKRGGRLVHLENAGRERSSWLMYAGRADLDPEITQRLPQEVWKSARSVGAAIAVPWGNGRPDPDREPRPVHVYFPTNDRTGRSVLIHGDFYVHSDRTRVHAEGAGARVTEVVAELVADLIAGAAEAQSHHGARLLRCLAPIGRVDGYGQALNAVIDRRLRETSFVRRAAGDGPGMPPTLKSLGPHIDLDHAKTITAMLNTSQDFVDPEIGADAILSLWLGSLGIGTAMPAELLPRIDPSRTALSYNAVLTALDQLRMRTTTFPHLFRDRPVVQDGRERWIRPLDAAIRVDGVPPLPPSVAIPTVRIPTSAIARTFIDWLEVDELDAETSAERVIEAATQRPNMSADEADELRDFLRRLWLDNRAELRNVRGQGAILVPCTSARGARVLLRRADSAYLPKSWTGSDALEQLFGGLGDQEFVAIAPPARGAGADRDYYAWLGVASEPRTSETASQVVPGSPLVPWMKAVDVMSVDPYRGTHTASYRRIARPWLDRIEVLLVGSRTTRGVLARFVGAQTQLLDDASVGCEHSSHSRKSHKGRAQGEIAWLLRTKPWLPAVDRDGRKLDLVPQQCWTEIRGFGRRLTLPMAEVPTELGDALGCGNPRRPTVDAIDSSLRWLKHEWPDLDEAPADVQATADWLFDRLQGALRGKAIAARTLPVPAHSARGRCWSDAPLIADLDGIDGIDGLMWVRDDGHTRAHELLRLERASARIDSVVRPAQPTRRADVVDQAWRVGLLSLVLRESDEPGVVAARMGRLEQVSCPGLDLELTFDSNTVRSPQVAYIEPVLDKIGRAHGGVLYLADGWEHQQLVVARKIAVYLGHPELADRILHFLRDGAEALDTYGVEADELADAASELAAFRRPERVPRSKRPSTTAQADPRPTQEPPGEGEEPKKSPTTLGERAPARKPAPAPQTKPAAMKQAPKRRPQKQRRLVTYIPPPGTPADVQSTDVTKTRTRSDVGGVKAVLEYEERAGRFPKEMSHGNKGYDIESFASPAMTGAVARYIEVKSTQGAWSETNIKLSRPQFEFANADNADRTWLYVVEHAQSDEPVVHAVHRVGQRADSFYFDRGWKALAENATTSSDAVIEEALAEFVDEVRPLLAQVIRLGAAVPRAVDEPIDELPDFDSDWIIEAAWPESRVGLVTDVSDVRDAYLAAQDWTVLHFEACSVDLLSDALELSEIAVDE